MFKKICIIGCGLIGSSLARAIKKNNLAEKIVSSNRSDAVNKKVIELKIVDDSSTDTKKMVDGSDLVVIATPLSSYEDVISKIKPNFYAKGADYINHSNDFTGQILKEKNIVKKNSNKYFLEKHQNTVGYRHVFQKKHANIMGYRHVFSEQTCL